jgi:putative restriction endonuclease
MNLPVFVITHSTSVARTRDVYLGRVEDWDDSLGVFLVTFDEGIRSRPLPTKAEEEQFQLKQRRQDATRKVRARPGQQRFSFNVLRRYGRKCAVCDIRVPEVLDAAHLVPDRRQGSYDARNGVVFCAVHHRAFDAGLFGIEPDTLRIHYKANGPGADSLRIDYETLEHLPKKPHEEALQWRWERWQRQ